jgi:hypothetical protein
MGQQCRVPDPPADTAPINATARKRSSGLDTRVTAGWPVPGALPQGSRKQGCLSESVHGCIYSGPGGGPPALAHSMTLAPVPTNRGIRAAPVPGESIHSECHNINVRGHHSGSTFSKTHEQSVYRSEFCGARHRPGCGCGIIALKPHLRSDQLPLSPAHELQNRKRLPG